MPVKLYRGRECEHRHEFAQFKEIYCLLTDYYRDQTIFMITNLRVNNGEIDCLLLRPDGPVMLECKSLCGNIYGTENDRFWHVITTSGKKIDLNCNLFTKSERDRWDIIDKFRKKLPLIIPDIDEKKIRNISAWGYFEKTSVYAPDQVNMRIAKWFNIVTAENLIEQLEISKSGYTLFEKDLQSFVDDFHVEPYSISCPDIDSTKKEVRGVVMDHDSEKPMVQTIPKQEIIQPSIKDYHVVKKFFDFNSVWDNIVRNTGNEFITKEGFKFIYTIRNADLIPSLEGWGEISRSDLEMAHAFGICDKPECYGTLFIAGKLIWAILHDSRINS